MRVLVDLSKIDRNFHASVACAIGLDIADACVRMNTEMPNVSDERGKLILEFNNEIDGMVLKLIFADITDRVSFSCID